MPSSAVTSPAGAATGTIPVAVERWKASGEVPDEDNAAQEFFRRVTFETYANALASDERTQLRAATLFGESLPVPVPALMAVGQAADVGDPGACLNRLIGLGLIDSWGEIRGVGHAAAAILLPGGRSSSVQERSGLHGVYLPRGAIARLSPRPSLSQATEP